MKDLETRKKELEARIANAKIELAICEAHLGGLLDAEELLAKPKALSAQKRRGRPRGSRNLGGRPKGNGPGAHDHEAAEAQQSITGL